MDNNKQNDLLNGLNKNQREGVLHIDSPLLLLAGAGSGKTLVITKKITYLITEKHIKPENIMAVTFTNKAANEMKERVCSMLPEIKPFRLFIRTFHSACLRILKDNAQYLNYREDFLILDEGDRLSVIKKIMKEENTPKSIKPKDVSRYISAKKNEMRYDIGFEEEYYKKVYDKYTEYEVKENVMDFDDLILNTIKLFEKEKSVLDNYKKRFKYILVDEFQDTNLQQYKLIKMLAQKNNKQTPDNQLTVVGDDDQSIYAFRGANVSNILNFENDFENTKIIRLEENYRCPKNVVEVALNVIKNNSHRHTKNVFSNKKSDYKIENWICYTDYEEAKSVANEIELLFDEGFNAKDIVILFRTNSQSRAYEKELMAHSINYKIVGGVGFYERAEIKDSISFLRLLTGFNDNFSIRRTINTPTRGIGEKTFAQFEAFADKKNLTLYDAIDIIEESNISKKALNNIKEYKNILDKYSKKINDDSKHIEAIFFEFLKEIDYFSIFKSDGNIRIATAEDNIKELFNAYYSYLNYNYENPESSLNIRGFLEETTLYKDNSNEDKEDAITLMTAHNAKGLEFEVVFITGLEHGVFPHYFSLEEENGIEEERRLFYVAITRAKQKLYLTYAKRRRISSGTMEQAPSSFLMEIPKSLLYIKEKANSYYMEIDEDAFDY